jgi:hypothetical protein
MELICFILGHFFVFGNTWLIPWLPTNPQKVCAKKGKKLKEKM